MLFSAELFRAEVSASQIIFEFSPDWKDLIDFIYLVYAHEIIECLLSAQVSITKFMAIHPVQYFA